MLRANSPLFTRGETDCDSLSAKALTNKMWNSICFCSKMELCRHKFAREIMQTHHLLGWRCQPCAEDWIAPCEDKWLLRQLPPPLNVFSRFMCPFGFWFWKGVYVGTLPRPYLSEHSSFFTSRNPYVLKYSRCLHHSCVRQRSPTGCWNFMADADTRCGGRIFCSVES